MLVRWQFVQGSDVTEQGGGITPIDAPTPSLIFREQAAVAGEGTALKVGEHCNRCGSVEGDQPTSLTLLRIAERSRRMCTPLHLCRTKMSRISILLQRRWLEVRSGS